MPRPLPMQQPAFPRSMAHILDPLLELHSQEDHSAELLAPREYAAPIEQSPRVRTGLWGCGHVGTAWAFGYKQSL